MTKNTLAKNNIRQYKALFAFTWISFFLIFPSWALPISVVSRASVFSGLSLFFFISAFFMNRWFSYVHVDKPVIVLPRNIPGLIKSNSWLIVVCCIAVVLHIYPLSFPILIIGDEALHLQNGLWIYDYIDIKWHLLIRIVFWILTGAVILIIKLRHMGRSGSEKSATDHAGQPGKRSFHYLFPLLFVCFLSGYFFLLKDIPYLPAMVRYPPLSKLLYFAVYSAFGIDHMSPRIIQMLFYLICDIYLYRSINLFYEKEIAVLGASIYLFLPVIFAYAHLAELASGTIMFIIVISFYFLRFIRYEDPRDLLLTAYLLGIGFLYKDPMLLMVVLCFIFLFLHKTVIQRRWTLSHFKILSISLVPIIPWIIISRNYNWRNYTFQLSNLTSLDAKVVKYILLISSNLSEVVFIIFVLAVLYVCCYKRNVLTAYFGLLFVAYYFAIVSDMAALSPRLSLTCYPTVAIFIAIFSAHMIRHLNLLRAVRIFTVVFTVYLIIICTVPPYNNRYLKIMNMKLHYFPSGKAMKWVKANVGDGEKILMLRILTSRFYRYKYEIDQDSIVNMPYGIDEVSTPEKLKTFYKENDLSYVMFPYSPAYVKDNIRVKVFEYLKNNPDRDFEVINKFNIDENYIYVYKYRPGLTH